MMAAPTHFQISGSSAKWTHPTIPGNSKASHSLLVRTMRSFSEHIVASSGVTLTEVTLRTLGTIGAAAYILSQSSKVTQGIVKLKQAQDIEAKLNALGDSINGLNSKLTGLAGLTWVVAQQTKPKRGRYRR